MRSLTFASVIVLAGAFVSSAGAATDDREEVATVIRTAVDQVLEVLNDQELSRQEKRADVIAVIDPLIDFKLLAMLSLGKKHWSAADEQQREEFTSLFVDTLKLSYFEKLELFTDETVEYEEPVPMETKGSPKYYVLTYVLSKGDRIKVGYELARRGDAWRVFDFEIEGVSIRKSYGSQYNDFLREGTFVELLDTMRTKLDEARERDAKRDSGS